MWYNCNISVLYLVYYWYMAVIYLVYIWYIFGIFLYYSWCIHVIYLMMQPMSVLCSCQQQQWHVSSNSDESSRPSNSGVLTAKALHHAGAAMSMRLMTGCGTLAGPNLELEDFQWPRLKGSIESPGLRHPGALGRPGRPAKWRHKRYDMYILGIHLVYTCQTFMLNKKCILMNDIMSPALVVICTC